MATHHSCLESPTDRVALRAAGHVVTQTQTGLKRLSTTHKSVCGLIYILPLPFT